MICGATGAYISRPSGRASRARLVSASRHRAAGQSSPLRLEEYRTSPTAYARWPRPQLSRRAAAACFIRHISQSPPPSKKHRQSMACSKHDATVFHRELAGRFPRRRCGRPMAEFFRCKSAGAPRKEAQVAAGRKVQTPRLLAGRFQAEILAADVKKRRLASMAAISQDAILTTAQHAAAQRRRDKMRRCDGRMAAHIQAAERDLLPRP